MSSSSCAVVQWCWSHAIEDLPHGSQGVLHGTEKAEIQIKIPRRSHGCLTQAVAWHTSANVLPCLFISASLPTLIIRIVMTLIQTQTQIKIQTQTYTNTQLHKYTDYGSHLHLFVHHHRPHHPHYPPLMIFPSTRRLLHIIMHNIVHNAHLVQGDCK